MFISVLLCFPSFPSLLCSSLRIPPHLFSSFLNFILLHHFFFSSSKSFFSSLSSFFSLPLFIPPASLYFLSLLSSQFSHLSHLPEFTSSLPFPPSSNTLTLPWFCRLFSEPGNQISFPKSFLLSSLLFFLFSHSSPLSLFLLPLLLILFFILSSSTLATLDSRPLYLPIFPSFPPNPLTFLFLCFLTPTFVKIPPLLSSFHSFLLYFLNPSVFALPCLTLSHTSLISSSRFPKQQIRPTFLHISFCTPTYFLIHPSSPFFLFSFSPFVSSFLLSFSFSSPSPNSLTNLSELAVICYKMSHS